MYYSVNNGTNWTSPDPGRDAHALAHVRICVRAPLPSSFNREAPLRP